MDHIIERVKSGAWAFSAPGWKLVSDEAKHLVQMLMQVCG